MSWLGREKIPCFGAFLPDSNLIRHNWAQLGVGRGRRLPSGRGGWPVGRRGEEVLAGEPFLAAAQAPFGEVLPGDGAGEDGEKG
jgi:hypothetical protein